jgi:hypothetical protein
VVDRSFDEIDFCVMAAARAGVKKIKRSVGCALSFLQGDEREVKH